MDKLLENIREYVDLRKEEDLKSLFSEKPIPDIIHLWHYLSKKEAKKIFLLLDLEKKVDLINALPQKDQESLVKSLSVENTKKILKKMEPDDLVDFIQSVSQDVRRSVWSSMDNDAKRETEFLLRFDEDDAAGLMTPKYTAIRTGLTVAQALSFVRKVLKDVEIIYYIYVVDELKRLVGVVSLKDLLSGSDDTKISDIMVKNIISVQDTTDQEDVAKELEENDLIAIPVVDRFNRLLGIVTFDDVIDVIREEQTEDIYKMGAMDGNIDKYSQSSIFGLIKKRIPWLLILLLAGTITANVLDNYEALIDAMVFFAIFMPVITQTGGNSGTQSSTLIIRGLATDDIHFQDIGRVLGKEILVGLVMGIAMGAVIFLRGMFLPPQVEIMKALSVGVSLFFVVMFSSIIGALAPLLIHRLGFDPTVAAGPLMATVIDVCGLTIFFEVSKMILQL